MNTLPRPHRLVFPLTVLLMLLSAGATWVSAQDKPVTDAQPKPPEIPTFVVKGRVVYDNTDRPVRRAQILLSTWPERRGADLSSATDREGRFAISNVPAGTYFVFVNEAGIITPLSFMTLNDNGPTESLDIKLIKEYCTEVVVDSSDVEVTVRARRGGAISGKVTYPDGDPAVNADIAIIRRANNQSTRILTGISPAAILALHTDDRGRFRISGVPPGEYVVSAGEKNTAPQNRNSRGHGFDGLFGSGDALTVTYYGGSANIADAIKLQVEKGSELNDIDITLPDTTPHAIRGSVIAKQDRIPLPGATILIQMKDQADWLDRGARQITTDDQGQWVAEDVPDGTYTLRVSPPSHIPVPGATPTIVTTEDEENIGRRQQLPTRKFVPAESQISVAGGDVVVEPILLAEGASISGTVELPNDLKESQGIYFQLAYRYENEPLTSSRNSASAYGQTFSIEGLREGKVYLSAVFSPYGLSEGQAGKYYLKSIKLNGADITNKPIAIKEGQSVPGVQIVIAEGRGKTTLKVITAEGKPAAFLRLSIVPVDQSRWLFLNDLISDTTDSQGQMSFTCAPGEYLVLVSTNEDVWPPTYASIKQRSVNAPRIKVSSGENKTFVVPVP